MSAAVKSMSDIRHMPLTLPVLRMQSVRECAGMTNFINQKKMNVVIEIDGVRHRLTKDSGRPKLNCLGCSLNSLCFENTQKDCLCKYFDEDSHFEIA